ncbi:MAG: cobalamin biosynthesis protein, partial [Hyphomicrobiales bacterium]|nr:cobalamin biosynthesis protein [Hyphomicrobiales bacterium]
MSTEALSAYSLWALPAALLLDALVGEPRWLWSRIPHPAVLIGRLIDRLDGMLNRNGAQRTKGIVSILILVAAAALGAFAITAIPITGPVFSVVLAAILLAQKSLVDHVRAVADALPRGLEEARREVAKIVGRDPASLQEPDIARAAIESAAENFSDGVIAPAFWFAVAGLPGIVVYKAVNTADSMIG